ncbi:hypothetical protein SLS56_011426 [Neofusicoccum ribis]|uniref:Uncharacterized protein n=1 Tax=Neofusicoccum ribis TaxID=45134 RepID=A0ABR3SD22_9PEZI
MFLMLLKTHNISINYQSISEAWPDDQGEKPTPRAISERLIKMRKQVGSSGGAVQAAITKSRGVNSTPSKPRAKPMPKPTVNTPSSTSNKRRRVEDDEDDDLRIISPQELRSLQVGTRSSPTPRHPTPRQHATNGHSSTSAAAAAPPRPRAPADSVIPSSESLHSRQSSIVGHGNGNGSGNGNGNGAVRPHVPHAESSRAAYSFAARTPYSMEPTATTGIGCLSVTPDLPRTTPHRSTSSGIKLEEMISDDDDALQGLEDDDDDISEWAQDPEEV